MDTISSNATSGTPADLTVKEDWRRFLKSKTDVARFQAYRKLNQLEYDMISRSSMLESEKIAEVAARVIRLEDDTENIVESHACQNTNFLEKFHGRYGTEVEIPQSGSDWNQIWSRHQKKLIGDTRVRYELGTGANAVPVCQIMPEYTLEKGDEAK
ncbi:hypothetical protein I302_102817 [Kwoniella bestiolae CBS 10118]|uniref:Uncharacterized protein n=1 Tax=Kwoniella bestiolae CBS 10118 TaxID=1296100 RepID=A0A1B9GGB6_9TREE|nr:hypothetical protein I302_01512 [Kwoniella bestiolae CBS 10118]OCF29995.1 hypothetical protein I302_01512 [Kwoniella bestiolae CBS 10118]